MQKKNVSFSPSQIRGMVTEFTFYMKKKKNTVFFKKCLSEVLFYLIALSFFRKLWSYSAMLLVYSKRDWLHVKGKHSWMHNINKKKPNQTTVTAVIRMGTCCPFLQAEKETILYFTCRLMETECLKAVYWCSQVCGCADRVHEEQGTGQVLQRAARSTEAFSASGLLPLETCPTHPQVPPAFARKKC